jgi:hypothetical protein
MSPKSTLGNGCMSNYKFKTVYNQKDLSGLGSSGIVGLSPTATDGAQLFIPTLYEQGAIKKNMFAMFLNHLNGKSKIQIGGYDLKKYAAKGEELHWNKLTNNMYWGFEFSDAKAGDFQINPTTKQMMADTGTSLNMLPEEDYYAIFNHFIKGKFECHKLPNTLHSCTCTDQQHQTIPDITFNVGNK